MGRDGLDVGGNSSARRGVESGNGQNHRWGHSHLVTLNRKSILWEQHFRAVGAHQVPQPGEVSDSAMHIGDDVHLLISNLLLRLTH